MKSHQISMTWAFLAASSFLAAQEAPGPARNPYAITLDAGYGWPFSTTGFSGRKATGLDGALSFEFSKSDLLNIGIAYNQVILMQDSLSASLGSADLFLRFLPFGRGSIEPYALLGAGGVIYSSISDPGFGMTRTYHADLALGALYSFSPALALDCALSYQMAGAAVESFNFAELRLGLQTRFGGKALPAVPPGAKNLSPTAHLNKN